MNLKSMHLLLHCVVLSKYILKKMGKESQGVIVPVKKALLEVL